MAVTAILVDSGGGKVLPKDKGKLKEAFRNFDRALLKNRAFARMLAWKRNRIARGMRVFAATDISASIILVHSLAEAERYAKQKKNQSR